MRKSDRAGGTGISRRWVVGAVLVTVGTMALQGRAQVLPSLFPEGVPGYGTEAGVTVMSRNRAAWEPPGVRWGGFLLSPRLETILGFNDNVLGGNPRRGSVVAAVRPSLLATSTWSRHAFGAFVALDSARYPGAPAQSRTDGTVSVGGAVDIGRDRLTVGAAHVAAHQDRTQLDALPSDAPVAIRIDDLRLAYAATSGRWTWTPDLRVSRWRFGETTVLGEPVSQSYRDRDVLRGGVTVGYELASLRSLVFVARTTSQHYPHISEGQARPDSLGYQVLAGLDYNDDALWRYRVLVGGESRRFTSAAFATQSAVITEAEVTWTPSGLTTVRASLMRGLEDAAQAGVAGYIYSGARITVDHEYRRDLILNVAAGVQHAAFFGGSGHQWIYSVGLGATWLINRSLQLSATYGFSAVRSGGAVASVLGSYDTRNLAMVTLRVGM